MAMNPQNYYSCKIPVGEEDSGHITLNSKRLHPDAVVRLFVGQGLEKAELSKVEALNLARKLIDFANGNPLGDQEIY